MHRGIDVILKCVYAHVFAKKGDPVCLSIVTCMSLKTVGNKKLWQTEIEVNMTKPFFKGLEGMVVKLDETRQQSCLSHCLVDLQLLESVFLSWFTSSNDQRAINQKHS